MKTTYVIMVIRKFAEYFSLSNKQAYEYLRDFSGISFLNDCYEAEHTLSFDDAVEDLARVCQAHGGWLKYA